MSDEINHDRRRFLRTIAPTVAAIQLGLIDSAVPQSGQAEPAGLPTTRPGTNTSFGSLKQIDAGILNVGYAEADPSDDPAVILLDGWPYDIYNSIGERGRPTSSRRSGQGTDSR
jgi:hypothetical protein